MQNIILIIDYIVYLQQKSSKQTVNNLSPTQHLLHNKQKGNRYCRRDRTPVDNLINNVFAVINVTEAVAGVTYFKNDFPLYINIITFL